MWFLITVCIWILLAALVGPIVGRCIRDGHGDETESQTEAERRHPSGRDAA